MPLGGYCPLPLRLGGNEREGVTAEQHKRLSSDLAAARRTIASAVFYVDLSDATISNYFGENGNGVGGAPSTVLNAAGDVSFTWDPPIWEDDFGVIHQVDIVAAIATCQSSTDFGDATAQVVGPNEVRVKSWNNLANVVSRIAVVKVWFFRKTDFRTYGGDVDKEDSKTEGERPYAWQIYRNLQAMRGDAYRKERSGYVHVELMAQARLAAWIGYRIPEEAVANRTPSTADSLLGYWVKVLGVPNRDGDAKWEVRKRCAVKYRKLTGASRAEVDDAFADLLGTDLVSIVRNYGSVLDTPPDFTYWPGVNPGPPELDLGGGTWMSHRSHVFFVLSRALLADRDKLSRLVNSTLFDMADSILPDWATFSWYLDGNGFIINESLIGYDAV